MAVSTLMATQASLIACMPLTAAALPPLPTRIRRPPPLSKLTFKAQLPKPSKLRISASQRNPEIKSPAITNPVPDLLSGPTRSVTTVVAIAAAAARYYGLFSLAVEMKEPLLHTAGAAFFAAVARERLRLHTPFTVVAVGMGKWLELYHVVLMVRVSLTWLPNVPWNRQPFSALRDLCDPYLNLFRNVIPPVFNTLDISSMFAFAVLECLAAIMKPATFG